MKRTIILIISIVIILFFTLYTDQIWEDFFITAKYSINFVEGNGLTHYPGDKIQGFTSPFNTLLLSFIYFVTCKSFSLTLIIFRIISILAYLFSVWFLLDIIEKGKKYFAYITLIPVMIYILESKVIAFSMNGMETGFSLFFYSGMIWVLSKGFTKRLVSLAFFWAGMIWCRPDNALYILIACMGLLLFKDKEEKYKNIIVPLLKASIIGSLFYLPWLICSWIYYDSPIPQTFFAKSFLNLDLTTFIYKISQIYKLIASFFLPPYSQIGGFDDFRILTFLTAFPCILFWLYPKAGKISKICSFSAFVATFYLLLMPFTFPWYLPVVEFMCLVALADMLYCLLKNNEKLFKIILIFFISVVISLFSLFIDYTKLARAQFNINDKNRTSIGLWLKDHADKGDNVLLECIGFIGYYSKLRIIDYPGIISPKSVEIRKKFGDNLAFIAFHINPKWIVLRPFEAAYFGKLKPGWLDEHYELVKVFDVRKDMRKAVPNHIQALWDSLFYVYKRK